MGYREISKENTKRMQDIGLKMIKFFDDFCRNNNLTYFLCGGCCIGAVRNKGFIPWDDDVDLFMPRQDYEKLKQIWKDTEKYELKFTTEKERSYNTAMSLHDKNTTFIKSVFSDRDVSFGVAMDIFPIDGCPNGLNRKAQLMWTILYSLAAVERAPQNHGILFKSLGNIFLFFLPKGKIRYRFMKFAEKHMKKYDVSDCEKITELCAGPHYMMNEYPKEAFEKQLFVDFEDTKLAIPVGYDSYLKIAFGDYMSLPPEKDRINHHEYEFIDLDKSYKEYKGIKY